LNLSTPLKFVKASIDHFALTPAEELKGVLVLEAPFSSEHASILGVDFLMNGTVVKQEVGKTVPLSHQLQDVILSLPDVQNQVWNNYYPEVVSSLKLARIEGGSFRLIMRAHMPAGTVAEIVDFVMSHKKETFSMGISSRQGVLFEGGSRVDMSAESQTEEAEKNQALFACDGCRLEQELNEDGTAHIDSTGQVTSICSHPSSVAVISEGKTKGKRIFLPSKREMKQATQ
jgi:hypothetical protein